MLEIRFAACDSAKMRVPQARCFLIGKWPENWPARSYVLVYGDSLILRVTPLVTLTVIHVRSISEVEQLDCCLFGTAMACHCQYRYMHWSNSRVYFKVTHQHQHQH